MSSKFLFNNREFLVLNGVYAPREDSFLLAKNVNFKKGCRVLDLGCGSGIQGINALTQGAESVVFADVNEKALECAKLNAKAASLGDRIEARKSNLFDKISERFDCIVFNPPYVPSESREHNDTDGGKQGREVLDLFLKQVPGRLERNGFCFFLQSSLNRERETVAALDTAGLKAQVVARQRLFFEELIVFKCFKG